GLEVRRLVGGMATRRQPYTGALQGTALKTRPVAAARLLQRRGPGSKCRPGCKMQRDMQAWCGLTSQADEATMARSFGTDPSWRTHSAPFPISRWVRGGAADDGLSSRSRREGVRHSGEVSDHERVEIAAALVDRGARAKPAWARARSLSRQAFLGLPLAGAAVEPLSVPARWEL
ncbi:MAG: hypothetical protein WBC80_16185, partial [Isosphaeraceae bacterium]